MTFLEQFKSKIKSLPFLGIFANRAFWSFFGTGLIISVAYMDPGNWGTSISGGAAFRYQLLWAIWFSSIAAMLFQYISGKIGVAGYSIGEIIRSRWSKKQVFIYWLLAEIVILATDLAEFLGIVVALNLLLGIPLIFGALIALFDVILLLYLTEKRFRILEYAFVIFVGTIGLSYLYEMLITKPDLGEVLAYSLQPTITPQTIMLIVGIIGATVMPHALLVHSWLMKNKVVELNGKYDKKKLLSFHKADIVISLLIASLINAAILTMAAAAFYDRGIQVATIEEAYLTLTPLFGKLASVIFAVGLLAAGISSSITGALSGQSIIETLTDFKLSVKMRRIITRFINLVPTLIAILLNLEPLTLLVWSQVILSLLIPMALLPIIYYSSKREIMGELVNRSITTYVAYAFAAIIIVFNLYLLYQTFFGGG
ncbi:Nramp family divalent metal transporter [Candidatus Micrarchaeota archaeon]|nr:Nramp family divalent metal transporter [Candidatus Micrarchaeota archaeon]